MCISFQAMRLSRTALRDTTVGQVVNLLSNDVSRFDAFSMFLNYMWISPLSAIVYSYLLYNLLGPAGLIGVAAIFGTIPIQCKKIQFECFPFLNLCSTCLLQSEWSVRGAGYKAHNLTKPTQM